MLGLQGRGKAHRAARCFQQLLKLLVLHRAGQILRQQLEGRVFVQLMAGGGLRPDSLVQISGQPGVAEALGLIPPVADGGEEALRRLADAGSRRQPVSCC